MSDYWAAARVAGVSREEMRRRRRPVQKRRAKREPGAEGAPTQVGVKIEARGGPFAILCDFLQILWPFLLLQASLVVIVGVPALLLGLLVLLAWKIPFVGVGAIALAGGSFIQTASQDFGTERFNRYWVEEDWRSGFDPGFVEFLETRVQQ